MEDLLNKIKDLMVYKNIQTLELPTYEWNPNPDSEADCGNALRNILWKLENQ